jgi:hypothetical protein
VYDDVTDVYDDVTYVYDDASESLGRKAPVVNSVEVIGLWLSFPRGDRPVAIVS